MNSPHRVLIIDDDPDILLTLRAYLEDTGYVVLQASDGVEGVDLFNRQKPDVVLTDLRMPKMDGFGVISAIRLVSSETPVIVFTGTGEHNVTKDVVQLGAWCCLYKPLGDLNNLIVAIELALENKGGNP